jgi:hypothetical protein
MCAGKLRNVKRGQLGAALALGLGPRRPAEHKDTDGFLP